MLTYSDRHKYNPVKEVSSRKYKPVGERIGVPIAKFPKLLDNIQKIYELCGENKSEAARRIGVSPQLFDRWLHGSIPSASARKSIAASFKIDQYTLEHGEIGNESPADYKAPPSRADQRYFDALEDILNSDDHEVVSHIKRQLLILRKRIIPSKEPSDS